METNIMNDQEIKERYLERDELVLERDTRKWCLEKALQHQSTASVDTLVATATKFEEFVTS